MPFTVDKLRSLPVVVFVQSRSQVHEEAVSALGRLIPLLDEQAEPAFLIMDLRRLGISLDELAGGSTNGALRPDALVYHRKLRETLIISADEAAAPGEHGIRLATFGSAAIRVFDQPAEAMAYCRRQIDLTPRPRAGRTGRLFERAADGI